MATFMELLERFVAAHEKQADAAMLMAENGKHECGCSTTRVVGMLPDLAAPYGNSVPSMTSDEAYKHAADMTGNPAGPSGVPMADLTDAIASAANDHVEPEAPTAAGWNPYTSPLQKVYRKPLAEVLDAELARLGIDPGDKLTGAQKHQLLLDHAAKGSVPAAPVEAPAAPAAAPMPAAPAAQAALTVPVAAAPSNYGEVKSLVYALYSKDPQKVSELLIKYAGCQKLVDAATGSPTVPQGQWANLVAEVNAALQGV